MRPRWDAVWRRAPSPSGPPWATTLAIYPAFSPKPAAFARPIATGELRSRLGFAGVSITDALGAASVRAFGGPTKAGLAAVRAGADLLLYADYREAAPVHRALLRDLRTDSLSSAAFEVSVGRVLRLRHSLSR